MVFNTGAALLDAIVLAVVSKTVEGTYGYRITQDVRQVIEVSESTLYPVLRRLQKDDCLEVYRQGWQEIGDKKDMVWRITTHCLHPETGKLIGREFPADANAPEVALRLPFFLHNYSEKKHCFNTAIMRQYQIPFYKDEMYIRPGSFWIFIIKQGYINWFINKPAYLYYLNNPKQYSRQPLTPKSRKWGFLSAAFVVNEAFKHSRYPVSEWFRHLRLILSHGLRLGMTAKVCASYLDKRLDRMLLLLMAWAFKIRIYAKNRKGLP